MDIIEIAPEKSTVELPTVALATVVYGLWLAVTYWHEHLPVWVLLPAGAWIVAWHMNMQHETIHGHPTPVRRLNIAIGTWPLALWLPYEIYRRSHLQHHNDARLTDPLDDPESNYLTRLQWSRFGPVGRAILRAQATLLGRMTIGPALATWRLWRDEFGRIAAGDRKHLRIFVRHMLEVAVVLIWVIGVCRMPFWTYVWCFAYPGTGLALVRSFAEHRANNETELRTAIVERAPILGLLFLNNNLHVAHHLRASLPWYRLPRFYRLNRDALIERNGGLVYSGYFEIARRYLLRPQDELLHPFLSDKR